MTVVVERSLRNGRAAVLPALQAAVARLDPSSRAQAFYHLGWTDLEGRPLQAPVGKAVRPTLALLSARAAGAAPEVGLPGAVAVELLHNFSLLHDDLMDGDVERRHRPTVWAVWGPASAILTGDALVALSSQVLLELGSQQACRAARLLADATQELVRGQVEDLAFERRRSVSVEECLRMAAGKTGALLGASAAIGAVLAGGEAATVSALSTFGTQLGLAFQLVDDLLGIWGEPSVTGKPVLADLRARKKSLPVTYALSSPSAAGRELAAWYDGVEGPGGGRRADTEEQLRRAAELVAAAGGREWAQAEADRRLDLAEQALQDVLLPSKVVSELTALARFVVRRRS